VSAIRPLLHLQQVALEPEFLDLAERGAGHHRDELPAGRNFEAGKVVLAQCLQPGWIG
jgi:hypothetical protein